jgi:hypothetical protein
VYYFCTYFDKNYLAQGLALRESLVKQMPNNFMLYVLSLDDYVFEFFQKKIYEGIKVIRLEEIEEKYPELLEVKPHRKNYEYYFTITPNLPWYIIERDKEVDVITYVDADIYFYQSPKILFDELGSDSVYIIPHFFSEQNKSSEIYGKYNVVFNTFKRDENGLACLDWWRKKCIEWCYDYVEDDKFADQKYLDMFPILFNGVKVCTNRGANLAIFNLDNSVITKEGSLIKVNGSPLVFYHFHKLRFLHDNLVTIGVKTDSDYTVSRLLLQKIYIPYILKIKKNIALIGLSKKLNKNIRLSKQLTFSVLLDILINEVVILVIDYRFASRVSLKRLFLTYKKIKKLWQN